MSNENNNNENNKILALLQKYTMKTTLKRAQNAPDPDEILQQREQIEQIETNKESE